MRKLKEHYHSEIRKECHKTEEYKRVVDRSEYYLEQMTEKDKEIKELYEEIKAYERRDTQNALEQDQAKIMYDTEKLRKFKSELKEKIEKELKKDENYATNSKTKDLEEKLKNEKKTVKKLQKKLSEVRLELSQLQDSVDSDED